MMINDDPHEQDNGQGEEARCTFRHVTTSVRLP